jgi:adenylate kinase family enzyme
MRMRIHITGASGAGTTTLASALARARGCRHFDSDDYYWLPTDPPYQHKRDIPERNAMLLADLRRTPACIESGSLVSWSEEITALFDRVVFLWIPEDLRLARLRDREQRELGAIDDEFMEWAAGYEHFGPEKRSRAQHESWLARLNCPVLRLEGDMTTAEQLARTCTWLETS